MYLKRMKIKLLLLEILDLLLEGNFRLPEQPESSGLRLSWFRVGLAKDVESRVRVRLLPERLL